MSIFRKVSITLLLLVFAQGCVFMPAGGPRFSEVEPTLTLQAAISMNTPIPPSATPLPSPTIVPTATIIVPTPLPPVTITAVDGNIYIRRGPGLPYNQIGVLRKGMSAQIIARDILSNWVQINIPGSDATGWVSIQTMYSRVDGDMNQLPDFTFTEWPAPAYIKNCTEHDMFVVPGNIYLYSLYTNAQYKNEVQVDPGTYTAYDMFLPDEPLAQTLEVREGVTGYITINGLGEGHKCP